MTPVYHVEAKDFGKVEPILRAAGISGMRRIRLTAAESVELTSNYWDGGSRSYWHFVDLATLLAVSAPTLHPVFDSPGLGVAATPVVPVPPGFVAIEVHHAAPYHDVTIYAHPTTLAPMLPAGDSGASEAQTIVLLATAALKNTYGGETGIRFREASRKFGISREAWETATAECITAGTLNKAGAITPKGRNAIANHPKRHSSF